MQKYVILFMTLFFSLNCESEKDTTLTPIQMQKITSAAGMLTRNLVYLPDGSNWSEPPSQTQLEEIETFAKNNTLIWPTFFRAAADTALKLEQIEMQAARDATLSEML